MTTTVSARRAGDVVRIEVETTLPDVRPMWATLAPADAARLGRQIINAAKEVRPCLPL